MTRTIAFPAFMLVALLGDAQPAIIVGPHVIDADRVVSVLREAIAQVPAEEAITRPIVVVSREDGGPPHRPPALPPALQRELAGSGRDGAIFTWGAADPTIYVLADALVLEQVDLVRLAAALVGAQHRTTGKSRRAAAAAQLRTYRALGGDDEDYIKLLERLGRRNVPSDAPAR